MEHNSAEVEMGVFEFQKTLRERFPEDSVEFRKNGFRTDASGESTGEQMWQLFFNGKATSFETVEKLPPCYEHVKPRFIRMALRAIYRKLSPDDYVRLENQNQDRMIEP